MRKGVDETRLVVAPGLLSLVMVHTRRVQIPSSTFVHIEIFHNKIIHIICIIHTHEREITGWGEATSSPSWIVNTPPAGPAMSTRPSLQPSPPARQQSELGQTRVSLSNPQCE